MGNQTSTRRSSNASQLPRSEHASAKATGTHEYLAVDGGLLFPATGIYKHVKQEWDQATVHKLIQDRRLAPFYRGLQDEYQLDSPAAQATLSDVPNDLDALLDDVGVQQGQEFLGIQIKHGQRSTEPEAHKRAERQAYERGTEECPICMMNYPSNMNMSRCCDQPICTECLVQIKRADPDVNHIEPEAVACPFCVEPDFGVVYTPPALMNRRLASGAPAVAQQSPTGALPTLDFTPTELVSSPKPANEPRRKSHSATSPDVVLIDTLYPQFSDKVEAVRAAIQRRANRRIVFRHVGDRLVPVGITSSRDMAALLEGQLNQLNNGGSASAGRRSNGTGSPRRQRRRNTNAANEGHPYGHVGQDLEDLMLNEAIRLSLLEAEESARRQPEDASRTATATAAPAPAPVPLPSGTSNNGRAGSASSSPAARLELDSPTTTAFELSRAFNDSLPDLHARNASPTPASSIRSGSISSSAPTPLPKSPVLATASSNPSSFSSSPLSRSPPEFSTTPAISSPLASMTPQLADSEAEAEVGDAERLRRQSSTHSSLVPRPLDTPTSEISSIFDATTAPYMQLED